MYSNVEVSRTVVHRKGRYCWVGEARDAEESSVVIFYADGSVGVYERPA